MKSQDVVRGMVVPALAAMSRPWLVAWSLSPLIDAPDTPAQKMAAEELSLLMNFRATHFEKFYDFAGANDVHANHHAAQVGVLTSWRYGNELLPSSTTAVERPPATALRAVGVDYRFETARTIRTFKSLAKPNTTLRVLLCDGTLSLDVDTAAAIGDWVRAGGTLWSTNDCASIDELGRPYTIPLLQADFQANGVGAGNVTMLKEGVSLQESEQFLTAMAGWSQIVEPRTPTRRHVGHHNAPSPGNATCPSVRPPLNEFPYIYNTIPSLYHLWNLHKETHLLYTILQNYIYKSCQASYRHLVKRLNDWSRYCRSHTGTPPTERSAAPLQS